MSKFSNEFKRLREQSGITQQEMGDALGISRSSVGMYEQGKREPDFETLERIADYFNVNMSTLIESQTRADCYNDTVSRLMAYFKRLNEMGQNEALQRLEELTELPKYRRR